MCTVVVEIKLFVYSSIVRLFKFACCSLLVRDGCYLLISLEESMILLLNLDYNKLGYHG